VNTKKFDLVVNVILYGSEKGFPEDFIARKHHVSGTTGLFMHILKFTDYVSVCAVLKTPIEVVDYLQFRERYLSEVEGAAARIEKWLLGRFLMSPDIPDPDLDGSERDLAAAVDNLEDCAPDFSAWKFLERMGDRVAYNERLGAWPAHHVIKETDYYDVLMAFARLRRTAMSKFSERMSLAIERAEKDQYVVRRFAIPNDGIGYLVLGLPRTRHADRRDYLLRLTKLAKYDMKVGKCAGVSVCYGEDAVDIAFELEDSRSSRVRLGTERVPRRSSGRPCARRS
jgi:hypothetical protein